MTRFRMIAGIVAGLLLAAPALAQARPYHHHHHHARYMHARHMHARYIHARYRHARYAHTDHIIAYRPYAGGWASDTGAVVDSEHVTNGPVPDTPSNRARYGGPMSYSGRMTAPLGN